MNIKPWVKMPVEWIRDGRMKDNFAWKKGEGAAAISALIIWITFVTHSEEVKMRGIDLLKIDLTYDEIHHITSLSRKLVADGVSMLVDLALIVKEKRGTSNVYYIGGLEPGKWVMLPARALYDASGTIHAFSAFNKRAVIELHALKAYLYYAQARDRVTGYTVAKYEKINEKTGIPEKRIHRANATLLATRLLYDIDREKGTSTKTHEPNKYYLIGYKDLFINKATPPEPGISAPPKAAPSPPKLNDFL